MEEHKWLIIKVVCILIFFSFTLIIAVDGCHKKYGEQENDKLIYIMLAKQNELIEKQNKIIDNLVEKLQTIEQNMEEK